MNRIAMITGAGSGVGRAVATHLSQAGWSVVLVGRKKDALDETAKALKGDYLVTPADIGDPAAVKGIFAQTGDKFGRLDLLFYCSHVGSITPAGSRPAPLRSGAGRTSTGRP